LQKGGEEKIGKSSKELPFQKNTEAESGLTGHGRRGERKEKKRKEEGRGTTRRLLKQHLAF